MVSRKNRKRRAYQKNVRASAPTLKAKINTALVDTPSTDAVAATAVDYALVKTAHLISTSPPSVKVDMDQEADATPADAGKHEISVSPKDQEPGTGQAEGVETPRNAKVNSASVLEEVRDPAQMAEIPRAENPAAAVHDAVVAPAPNTTTVRTIAAEAKGEPVWKQDQDELFRQPHGSDLVSAAVNAEQSTALLKPRVLPVAWLLVAVAWMTTWVAQDSIAAYWQQTYHRESPLESLKQFAWWQAGAQLKARVGQASEQIQSDFLALNDEQIWVRRGPNMEAATTPVPPLATAQPSLSQRAQPAAAASATIGARSQAVLQPGNEVLFAGDSLMQGVAPYVQQQLKQAYALNSVNLSRQSTGLSYPSFFDWPQTIENTLQANPKIKLLVIFLGPNDPWNFPNPQQPQGPYLTFKSSAWEQVYRSRVERILSMAQKHQVQVMWLGIPAMRKPVLNQQMTYLNGILSQTVAQKAIWLPTQPLLSKDDHYADSLTLNGVSVKLRSKDGIHFSLAGQKRLASDVFAHIQYQIQNLKKADTSS